MNSLQSSLAQRHMDPPSDAAHVCHSFADAVGTITFTTWQSGIWVLPWVHFLGAHHVVHAKGERIDFIFAQYEVKAEGQRLVLLMPGIAAGRLATLSEVPERFAADLPAIAHRVVERGFAAAPPRFAHYALSLAVDYTELPLLRLLDAPPR